MGQLFTGGQMIKYVSGDILFTKAECIAHGVSPNDNFAQGLALSIRKQWPALYKDFKHHSQTCHPKEGGLWIWRSPTSPIIINLFTQEHPSSKGGMPRPAMLKYVRNCLKELGKEAKKSGLKNLAITKLATGVGKLDWNDVKPLLEEYLSPLSLSVFVYETFIANSEADESLSS